MLRLQAQKLQAEESRRRSMDPTRIEQERADEVLARQLEKENNSHSVMSERASTTSTKKLVESRKLMSATTLTTASSMGTASSSSSNTTDILRKRKYIMFLKAGEIKYYRGK